MYADWGNGNVWGLRWDGKQAKANKLVARTRLKITSFGEDEAGEVCFTAFDGHIYRFRSLRALRASRSFRASCPRRWNFSMVCALVAVMNGSVFAESEMGKPSTFTVFLPVAES